MIYKPSVALRFIIALFLLVLVSVCPAQGFHQRYVFSKSNLCPHCNLIDQPIKFLDNYGFDLNTEEQVQLSNKGLFSNRAFYFSVAVPEGNYLVTIEYKGLDKPFYSTVRSESRRWQLDNVLIKPNKREKRSFVVHIKDKKINETKSVRLKTPREVLKLDWDSKLTLEFQGTNHIEAIEIKSVIDPVTVFLAGNSTVCNQEEEPWASWGQMITRYFNTRVVVANHAESGLSLGSFLSQNRLDKILEMAKPGDYLFIEFGHNDQKEKGEDAGAFKNYSERLMFYVSEFRKKGGIPIILTSTARRSFDQSGVLQYTLGDFPEAARQVATTLNVPLIDLNKMTRSFYEAMGEEGSKNAFVHYPAGTFPGQLEELKDNTHFNTYGAFQIAKMVLKGIKENKLSLARYIVDYKDYNPTRPDFFEDWHWPSSPINSALKPDGN